MTLDYDTWQANKSRPVWVRGHRPELDALTAADADRVPDSVAAVSDWVDRYESVIARELREEGDNDG